MELLQSFGVTTELHKDEFVRRLERGCTADQARGQRDCLFADALSLKLAVDGDVLVTRMKRNAGKTVKEKHVEDVWTLVGVILRREAVPRVLLKNGKQSLNYLVCSRNKERDKKGGSAQKGAAGRSGGSNVAEAVRARDVEGEAECSGDVDGEAVPGEAEGPGDTGEMLGDEEASSSCDAGERTYGIKQFSLEEEQEMG